MDIINPKTTKFTVSIDSILSLPVYAYFKDINGCYIAVNGMTAKLAGKDSVKDVQGGTDLDFSWREATPILIEHDNHVKKNNKTFYFVESVLSTKREAIDFLVIKAPLISQDIKISGIGGTSIPLNQTSFNNVMTQFMQSADKLKLKLDPRIMVKIITQAMQFSHCHREWSYDSKLFDYGKVAFTLREAQCLHYLLKNYSACQTGRVLGISPKTVEFHIANLKKKISYKDKSQLANMAIDIGFIDIMFMNFSGDDRE